jgi:hypothetical protein
MTFEGPGNSPGLRSHGFALSPGGARPVYALSFGAALIWRRFCQILVAWYRSETENRRKHRNAR